MNRIPKCKTKISIPQPFIKVTKKESLEKNSNNNHSIHINNYLNNKANRISQKKLKFSNDSSRHFGDDISSKIKNSISPNISNNQNNRKSLSNIDAEKVIYTIYNFLKYRHLLIIKIILLVHN